MIQTATIQIAPVRQSDRIQSLAIMRGFVLCGILLMNINGFGLGFAYNDPSIQGGDTGLNLYTWMMTNLFFEGTMRALFSLLFGLIHGYLLLWLGEILFELLYVVLGIWIFQLILSPIWLRYFQYGPMEWLWRNLSYLKVHAIKKEKNTNALNLNLTQH